MQNQLSPQEVITELDSVMREIELSDTQVNESLQIIREQTAAAHITLQKMETALQSGENEMGQKLQALVIKARQ